jgi:hypothetical protein
MFLSTCWRRSITSIITSNSKLSGFLCLALRENARDATGRKRRYARVIAKHKIIQKDKRKVMIPISAKPITKQFAADEKAWRPSRRLYT